MKVTAFYATEVYFEEDHGRIFVLTAVLLCFFGCEGKENGTPALEIEKNAPKGPYTLANGDSFYFDVTDSYVVIYKSDSPDTVFQAFGHIGVESTQNSLNGMRFEDFSFDGNSDLLVPWKRENGIVRYYGYIWISDSKIFEYVPSATSVGNLSVGDGFLEGECLSVDGETYKVKYTWNGDGTIEEQSADGYASAVLEISKAIFDKSPLDAEYAGDILINKTLCK